MGKGSCSLCHSFPHTLSLFQLYTNISKTGFCISPRTAPAWVLSMGCSPSGTDCCSVCTPQGHKSCQQPCSSVVSMGSSSFGDIHLLQHWVLRDLQESTELHLCSVWTSMGCRSTAVSPWSTWRDAGESLPQILGHLLPLLHCSAELLLSLILTHLAFGCNLLLCCEFFPLLNYVIPEVLPQSPRLSLGQQWVFWSHLTLTVTHWGRFWQLLAVDTPVEPIPSAKIWP